MDEAEEATLQHAADHKLEIPELAVQRYDLDFLKGDQAGMDQEVALASSKAGPDDLVTDRHAFVLAFAGHLQEAKKLATRAAGVFQQPAESGRKALIEIGPALWDAFFGNAASALKIAGAAADRSKDRDVEFGAAFALALGEETFRSATIANDLEKRFPEDTAVRVFYVPAIRALLALNARDASKAISLLESFTSL